MFTGIIEEKGKIQTIQRRADGLEIQVACHHVLNDLSVDNSIALDGVCQTVIDCSNGRFSVFAAPETLRKTTLKKWKTGTTVNLERALRANARLGGHLVQGHVDCTGIVTRIIRKQETCLMDIRLPQNWAHLTVTHGSVCLNGVSLTIARKSGLTITVSIIPFTLNATNLSSLKKGDSVNIETDIIGKYLYQFQKESK
ncbi:MAG: riboflavin synthase [Acidobacteria bacterium]|nr:MAG: riboflavin synthase [Acidobacteriota bacterium]RLE24812.1 MAG: riboflavin synthase [Acidobacteriota bacterium]